MKQARSWYFGQIGACPTCGLIGTILGLLLAMVSAPVDIRGSYVWLIVWAIYSLWLGQIVHCLHGLWYNYKGYARARAHESK